MQAKRHGPAANPPSPITHHCAPSSPEIPINMIRLGLALKLPPKGLGQELGTSVSFFDLKLNQTPFGLVLNLKKQTGLFLV